MKSLHLAFARHAEAISYWGAVQNARNASSRACEYHVMGEFHPLGTHNQPVQDILAACRDAEALAAIDAHADAIKMLVRR